MGAAAYNFAHNLTLGSSGEDVTQLQMVLIADGYLSIKTPTGTFGPLTKAALKRFQAFHGIPQMGAYCASKAGVSALLDSLRVELRPLGIATTTICPGWIRTPMTQQPDLPPGIRLMELADAVALMMKAIRLRRKN